MNFHSPFARCLMQRTPDILIRLSTFVGYFCIEKFIFSWPVQAKSDRLLVNSYVFAGDRWRAYESLQRMANSRDGNVSAAAASALQSRLVTAVR